MAKNNGNLKRDAVGAFVAGTALGASMMAVKHKREKSPIEKLMDRMSK